MGTGSQRATQLELKVHWKAPGQLRAAQGSPQAERACAAGLSLPKVVHPPDRANPSRATAQASGFPRSSRIMCGLTGSRGAALLDTARKGGAC